MAEVVIKNSIEQFNKQQWNNCFDNILEDYDYLLATEKAGIKGFEFFYIAIVENNTILAAAHAFITKYDISATTSGVIKSITNVITKIFPNFLKLTCAAIGSIETERNYLGFLPGLSDEEKKKLLIQILDSFENFGKNNGAKLFGMRDIPESEKNLWSEIMESLQYKKMNSLPTAILEINFKSFDEYFNSLSYKTRKDMRRKMKVRNFIKVTKIKNLESFKDIMNLYFQTKDRRELEFAELTEDFFKGVSQYLKDRAVYSIYSVNDHIIGFDLSLINKEILIDKFIFLKEGEGKKYNLYFNSWFDNVKYCIENKIKIYQAGQSEYKEKLKLGCKLLNNYLYFRHDNYLIDKILRLISPLLEVKVHRV